MHGNVKHGMCDTPTYNSWRAMKERCTNPNNSHYKHYGGRGITIFPKWLEFTGFWEDMGTRPEGYSLERIDNDKDYHPDNCKWADEYEQAANHGIRVDNSTGYKYVFKRTNKVNKPYYLAMRRKKKTYIKGMYFTLEEALANRENFMLTVDGGIKEQ